MKMKEESGLNLPYLKVDVFLSLNLIKQAVPSFPISNNATYEIHYSRLLIIYKFIRKEIVTVMVF